MFEVNFSKNGDAVSMSPHIIDNRTVSTHVQNAMRACLNSITPHLRDGDYCFSIVKVAKKRSRKQLNYHFAVVVKMMQELLFETQGHRFDTLEAHRILKIMAGWGELVHEKIEIGGLIIQKHEYSGRSFGDNGDITRAEYCKALDTWVAWFGEQGYTLNMPNETQLDAMFAHFSHTT
jgi:hypothetical protein